MSEPRRADRAPRWVLWAAGAVAVGVALAGAVLGAGAWRWRADGRAVADEMASSRRAPATVIYSEARLDGLPAPVRRYLSAVLTDGQPLVTSAALTQDGQFLIDPEAGRWVPFTAAHQVIATPPAFDWDARMPLAPGLTVFVRDAYVGGEGRLRAALLGLWTVAFEASSPELAEGELERYLAEAVWYPTVLLPGDGLTWEGVDDATARARLVDGEVVASLDFRFGADGLVAEVAAADRPRLVDGAAIRTPWLGRFGDYAERRGMRVPHTAEVEWVLPEGPQPYWRGRLVDARYVLTR